MCVGVLFRFLEMCLLGDRENTGIFTDIIMLPSHMGRVVHFAFLPATHEGLGAPVSPQLDKAWLGLDQTCASGGSAMSVYF